MPGKAALTTPSSAWSRPTYATSSCKESRISARSGPQSLSIHLGPLHSPHGLTTLLQVFIRQAKRTRVIKPRDALPYYQNDEEWLLDTEGVNLMEVKQVDQS